MAFARFVRAAITSDPITIYGDGSQIRDFTFISDVVRANMLAAAVAIEPGTVVNISGGDQVSINDTLDILSTLRGSPLDVHYSANATGDVYRTCGDNAHAYALLGWSPRVGVEEGLQRHYSWMSSRNATLASRPSTPTVTTK